MASPRESDDAAAQRRAQAREVHRSRWAPSPASNVLAVLLIIALVTYFYLRRPAPPAPPPVPAPASTAPRALDLGPSCDGRTQCAQMTSCTEAKYFLANCPGVQMDSNHNGLPCEKTWCGSPLAK